VDELEAVKESNGRGTYHVRRNWHIRVY